MTKIMIIAGTDSSGGAGLTRDTVTASMLGFEILPVVTAVTAQTNAAVVHTTLLSPETVVQQIKAALITAPPLAIKIGMLGSNDIATAVAHALTDCPIPIVLDPVIKSSSGARLLSGPFPNSLLQNIDVITPNLPEAAILTRRKVAQSACDITAQARAILAMGPQAVLIKGGHGQGEDATDHYLDGSVHLRFNAPRLASGKRGTGCTLATAIACNLARGHRPAQACEQAKIFTHAWLRNDVNPNSAGAVASYQNP